MKKYGKYIGLGIGSLILVFVLLQYQNCGSSSSSGGSTIVGASGLSYSINISTPNNQTSFTQGTQANFQVAVQDSGVENIRVVMGYLQNGNRNAWCTTSQETTPIPTLNCNPTLNQPGTYQLFVEVDDQSGQQVFCQNNTSPGCNGLFTISVH